MSSEPLNVLRDSWLPVLRRSGRADTIRPARIAGPDTDDPIIELAWPRPDFRIAAIEFLIGLLACFAPPGDEIDWREWWHGPPGAEALDAALAPYAHAFTLDGDGPRFMQDFDALSDGAENDAGALLIEAPGAQTLRNNADLLVKRGRVARLGRPAAAMALFTLQTYAPGGGAGHRVGLRGGGPLTTLVVPEAADGGPTLWQVVWANVRPGKAVPPDRLSRVLPWLAPTPTSEKNRTALAAGLEATHAFWGMPRRIRLDFGANPDGLACDLTGTIDAVTVTTWRTRPHGIFYQSWVPPHPLSPHYQTKKTEPLLPLHGQPTGIGYRDWVGLVVEDKDGRRQPAVTVSHFRAQRAIELGQRHPRLLAAGYDMDNMKARGFVESEMPLPPATADRAALDDHIRALVRSAGMVSDALRFAVRNALFSPGAAVDPAGATVLTAVRERFWRETTADFYAYIDAVARLPARDGDAPTRPWLNILREAALRCFDGAAPLDPDRFRDTGEDAGQRIVRARSFLTATLAGYGKSGRELFELLTLALPESAKSKNAKRSA